MSDEGKGADSNNLGEFVEFLPYTPQVPTGEPDDTPPPPQRQAELRAAYDANVAAGEAPYAFVHIRTLGELHWVMRERNWSPMPGSFYPEWWRSGTHLLSMRGEPVNLSRADLTEVNLAGVLLNGANLSDSTLSWANLSRAILSVANLRGANLRGADLSNAHLIFAQMAGTDLTEATLHNTSLHHATLSDAVLKATDLHGAVLTKAHMRGVVLSYVNFRGARLNDADLQNADLDGADLREAVLIGADLQRATLRGARLQAAQLGDAHLQDASMSYARMNIDTNLTGIGLNERTLLADVVWDNAPMTRVNWQHVRRLGDETVAWQARDENDKPKNAATRRADFEAAVRANRVLAVTLRSQGLNEVGDRYAYRARVLQREVLRRQGNVPRWLLESLLGAIAGYGYKPQLILGWYLLLVVVSTAVLTWQAYLLPCTGAVPCPLQDVWGAMQFRPDLVGQALVQSFAAIHGRGLFPQGNLTGWELGTTAFDAVAGLVIEAIFVATAVQRFFAR